MKIQLETKATRQTRRIEGILSGVQDEVFSVWLDVSLRMNDAPEFKWSKLIVPITTKAPELHVFEDALAKSIMQLINSEHTTRSRLISQLEFITTTDSDGPAALLREVATYLADVEPKRPPQSEGADELKAMILKAIFKHFT